MISDTVYNNIWKDREQSDQTVDITPKNLTKAVTGIFAKTFTTKRWARLHLYPTIQLLLQRFLQEILVGNL